MQITRAILALVLIATAGEIHASTFTYSTPSGAKDPAGNTLSAQAIFVISSINGGTNNQLQITIDNNSSNPTDDGQTLTALTFQLVNQAIPAGATISLSESITEAITISGTSFSPEGTCNGTIKTGCSTYTSNWTTTDTVTGTASNSTVAFAFCDANVTAAGCPASGTGTGEHTYTETQGIIGGPNTSSQYTNGSSLSGLNPDIFEQAVFTATLSTGSFDLPQDNYTNVILGFGQTNVDDAAILAVAPEPSSFWMTGAIFALGFAGFQYRRKYRKQS